jgi:hypothetical protein
MTLARSAAIAALFYLLTLSGLTSIGCAASPSEPVFADIQVADRFEGVAVFSLKPDTSLERACGAAECQVNAIPVEDLSHAFEDLDAFERITIGGTEEDFGIAIGTSHAGRKARTIAVTALVLWRGRQLETLNYELPFTPAMAVASDGSASVVSKSIATHILRDVVHQRLFTPERVHAALDASDYDGTLIAPANIDTFTKYSLHKFVDPLLGVAIRYRHAEIEGGHIDVFVYPVRASRWPVAQPILEQESLAVRQDLDRLTQQGIHQLVRLSDDEMLHWAGASGRVELLKFEGEFANREFQPYDTSTYLYLEQDKLVKVRATNPRNVTAPFDADAFVKALMSSLQVPPESEYMKLVRKHWRSQ